MKGIERLFSEWQSLQPIKPEARKKLDDKFKLEFNYNSNHIEGNTLTYGQTKLLLLFDETSGSASLRDYEEMKAHNVGLEMVKREASERERPLTESFIRDLNKVILVQDFWKDAKTPDGQDTRMEVKVGEYKSRPNSVVTATGEVFNYASPQETPAFMSDLVKWYNGEVAKGELSPIELAALLHYRYIRIHPFEDGNGRIARLLVNFVLYRYGYPMIVIHSEDKPNYLRVLHQCDVEVGLSPSDGASASLEKIQPFVGYIAQQEERALRICIKGAKGESIEEESDFDKRVALLKRKTQEKKIEKSSESVKNDVFRFLNLAASIEQKLEDVKGMFDSYAVRCDGKRGFDRDFSFSLYDKKSRDFKTVSQLYKSFNSETYDFFNLGSLSVDFIFRNFKNNGENVFDYSCRLMISFDLNNSVVSGEERLPEKEKQKIIFDRQLLSLDEEYYIRELLPEKETEYNSELSEEEMSSMALEFCNGVLKGIERKIEAFS